jgi:hypothetical protein
LFEGELDALFAYVVVKDASDLRLAQALRVHIKSLADAAGRGVDGSRVEEETGAGAAVIPYSQGGMEMAKFDHRTAVESGIEGTEAQDLGLGTAGGGSVYIGAAMAQTGITIVPQLLCGWAAAEDEAALGVDPVQSAAQVAGQGRQLLRRESAAVGE